MSASQKKKLRKQENAAAMTEKQQQEMKEAKKLRLYTILFTVAIAVMVCVVIVTSVINSGIIERNSTALTVGNSKVSVAELNHYYVDSINSYMNEMGSYVSLLGLDTSVPLNEQFADEATGHTWADYFLATTIDNIKQTYAFYNAAVEAGYTLDEESKESIDLQIDNMAAYATMYGYTDADSYIAAMYGKGCNAKSYRDYAEVQYIASQFAEDYHASLVYTDEQITAESAENAADYTSYTYNYVYLNGKNFAEGTTDADGNTTYTDAQTAAGLAASKEAADELAKSTSVEELDAAYAALSINAEKENAASTLVDNTLYTSLNTTVRDWVASPERKAGDIQVIPYTTDSTDAEGNTTTVTNGYYVVLFGSSNDNTYALANVRHILIAPEGGTYDSNTGSMTYTDEEKAAAKEKADALLAQFLAGEVTDDAFAALVKDNSTDEGSIENGGLYEDVYPGQMVPNFNDWCFDESRQAGDTDVVETDYGYHVMFYSGDSETTYREYLITNALRTADYQAYEQSLLEKTTVTEVNTSKVPADMVLS